MMKNYVFVGAEAYGNYSGSYACEGVFVTEEFYEKYKELLENTFNCRSFYELDGKHSEVSGDLVVKKHENETQIVEFTADGDVSYETYHLLEYLDDIEDEEDVDISGVTNHVTEVYEEIETLLNVRKSYTFVLTPEQYEEVTVFINGLNKEAR